MHPVSWTNTHSDVRNLVNHGMFENTKTEYLENETLLYYEIKKFLTSASDGAFWEVIAL